MLVQALSKCRTQWHSGQFHALNQDILGTNPITAFLNSGHAPSLHTAPVHSAVHAKCVPGHMQRWIFVHKVICLLASLSSFPSRVTLAMLTMSPCINHWMDECFAEEVKRVFD